MKWFVIVGFLLLVYQACPADDDVIRYDFEANGDTVWFRYGTQSPEKYLISYLEDTVHWELHYEYMSDGRLHDFVFYSEDDWLLVPNSDKIIEITIHNARDTGVMQIYYVGHSRAASFGRRYTREQAGQATVEIPGVFELANIAIAITDYGLENPNRVLREGEYYEKVLEHFMPFKNHPLIAQIEFSDESLDRYYSFRDNAFRYRFVGQTIVAYDTYSFVRWPDLFGEYLELVTDFALVSGFQEFYRDNLKYYQEEIQQYKRLVPLQDMWSWLEDNFNSRYGSYRVVFSPLIKASHETVMYEGRGFREIVMFVAGPRLYQERYSGFLEEAMLSLAVFTEIDHNYVNPATEFHPAEIDDAFSDVSQWSQNRMGYNSPMAVFLEYMTWAVFLVYASDKYETENFRNIKSKVEEMMTRDRGFVKFTEFSDELLELYRTRDRHYDLQHFLQYIIRWAAKQ